MERALAFSDQERAAAMGQVRLDDGPDGESVPDRRLWQGHQAADAGLALCGVSLTIYRP
ncbi:hypothetical protein ACIHFE_30300 [Streptomyces sp. NPDC052396]|uniref:hypothetical protein n=1 Tax=Streptomyces sp. NPDC052396 TaxID=3365689 RepID=UPI0037D5ACE3